MTNEGPLSHFSKVINKLPICESWTGAGLTALTAYLSGALLLPALVVRMYVTLSVTSVLYQSRGPGLLIYTFIAPLVQDGNFRYLGQDLTASKHS